MVDFTFGFLAIALTIAAYSQTDRLQFLKINVFAVFFFGLSLFINHGLTGAIVSFVNVAVYITAIFTSKQTRKKLSVSVPFIAFAASLYSFEATLLSNELPMRTLQVLPFIPAIASFFITLSALQSEILVNKIILFIGILIWAFYSFILGAWYAMLADVIGLVVIVVSIYKIKGKKLYFTH